MMSLAVVQKLSNVPVRIDFIGDAPFLVQRVGSDAPVGIGDSRDRAGSIVRVGPLSTVAATHERVFQINLVIEKNLEQAIVATRMSAPALFEWRRWPARGRHSNERTGLVRHTRSGRSSL